MSMVSLLSSPGWSQPNEAQPQGSCHAGGALEMELASVRPWGMLVRDLFRQQALGRL